MLNTLLISWPSYQVFLLAWMSLAVLIFFILLKIKAPYGRHSSSNWGPMVSNRFGWLFMELPVLIVLFFFLVPASHRVSSVSWFIAALFTVHYINRVFIFPFRIHTQGKKIPLVIVASAIFFNLVNGFSLGYYFVQFATYSGTWFSDIRFISGLLIFITGMLINIMADNMLIGLRKPGETHYLIPRGWLFNKISCPNLFGELIEWMGFAIFCWNLPAFTFFIWTAANLIPRALAHHKWYQEKFSDYPTGRKAIIPFLV